MALGGEERRADGEGERWKKPRGKMKGGIEEMEKEKTRKEKKKKRFGL